MSTAPRRYQLVAADVKHAKTWIASRVMAQGACDAEAQAQFERLGSRLAPLQHWCDQHLSAPQWRRLQAAIRSRRRKSTAGMHVRLSPEAYRVLHLRAQRDGVTLSEAVLRLALPPAAPEPGVVRIKTYQEDASEPLHVIECAGQWIGGVTQVSCDHWLAWLDEDKIRAEGESAEAAMDAVLRQGRLWVRTGAEDSDVPASPVPSVPPPTPREVRLQRESVDVRSMQYDGTTIGRVQRRTDGRWTANLFDHWGEATAATPGQAKAALLKAQREQWGTEGLTDVAANERCQSGGVTGERDNLMSQD